MNFEVSRTERGRAVLRAGGYAYVHKRDRLDGSSAWECSKRRDHGCAAKADLDQRRENMRIDGEHAHPPSADGNAARVLRSNLMERAARGDGTTRNILASELEGVEDSVIRAVGHIETLKRRVREKKQGITPADPRVARELDIPDAYTVMSDGRQFLQYDSGPDSADTPAGRVIIFATDRMLGVLASSEQVFADGNFSMSPRAFLQTYVFRALVGDRSVTAAYAFLSRKTRDAYEQLLNALVNRCADLGSVLCPGALNTDFESAMLQASQIVFGPHCRQVTCYYHLSQSLWRKMQEFGLQATYKEEAAVELSFGRILALAFLPVEEVVAGMEHVRGVSPMCMLPVLDYFRRTYVVGDGGSPPMFDRNLWNMRQVTMDRGHRTNNISEAWNNAFFSLVGHKHPTVWRSIEGFKKDVAMDEAVVVHHEQGMRQPKKVKRTLVEFQNRVRNMCEEYERGERDMETFIRGVARAMKP